MNEMSPAAKETRRILYGYAAQLRSHKSRDLIRRIGVLEKDSWPLSFALDILTARYTPAHPATTWHGIEHVANAAIMEFKHNIAPVPASVSRESVANLTGFLRELRGEAQRRMTRCSMDA